MQYICNYVDIQTFMTTCEVIILNCDLNYVATYLILHVRGRYLQPFNFLFKDFFLIYLFFIEIDIRYIHENICRIFQIGDCVNLNI